MKRNQGTQQPQQRSGSAVTKPSDKTAGRERRIDRVRSLVLARARDRDRMRERRANMSDEERAIERMRSRQRQRQTRDRFPESPPSGYVSIRVAAEQTGVPDGTIRRYAKQGMNHRVGIFLPRDWVEGTGHSFKIAVRSRDVLDWQRNEKRHKDAMRTSQDARCRHKRRAAKLKTTAEDLDAADEAIAYIKSAPRLKCYWCNKVVRKDGRHVEHIIPLSKGGAHAPHNLACSCQRCNNQKKDRMPEMFSGQYEIALWSSGATLEDELEGLVDTGWIVNKYGVKESAIRGRRNAGTLKAKKIRGNFYYSPKDVDACYTKTPPVKRPKRDGKKTAAKKLALCLSKWERVAKAIQKACEPKPIKYTKADLVWPTRGDSLMVPARRGKGLYWCRLGVDRAGEMHGHSWSLRKHHSGLQLKRSLPRGRTVIARKPYVVPRGAGQG